MIYTSLAKIKALHPCYTGWKAISRAKEEIRATQEFPLTDALESNNLDDVLWYLGETHCKAVLIAFAEKLVISPERLEDITKKATFEIAYKLTTYANELANAAAERGYPRTAVAYLQEQDRQKAILREVITQYGESEQAEQTNPAITIEGDQS